MIHIKKKIQLLLVFKLHDKHVYIPIINSPFLLKLVCLECFTCNSKIL